MSETEYGARPGPWVAVIGGFLCDGSGGRVEMRDQVAYWVSSGGGTEFVLDLTEEAIAEAVRRNRRAAETGDIPPGADQ